MGGNKVAPPTSKQQPRTTAGAGKTYAGNNAGASNGASAGYG